MMPRMGQKFLVLGALLLLAGSANAVRSGVSPKLEPVSDKKFFGADYPDDHSPKSKMHFGHPYPEVQDDDRYDRDYVTDKNDDGGHWEAQMEFDKYKNRLRTQKQDLKEAVEKEQE